MVNSSFAARFREECIAGSGIDATFFETSIKFIEDTGFWEPNVALGHDVSRFHQKPPHHYKALAAFINEDGSLWQAKPEFPRTDFKKKKPIKYESIKDGGNPIFTPPVPREIWKRIAERYKLAIHGENFWEWVKQHPEIPIVITEGGKKSLALLSNGYVAISLYGCNGVSTTTKDELGFKIRRETPKLADGLQDFVCPKRRFNLAFDQDSKAKTNENVERAVSALAYCLKQQECDVFIVNWDGKNDRCKGVDDLIVNEGISAWQNALEDALTSDEWLAYRSVKRRLNRPHSFHIGTDEFTQHLEKIPHSGIAVLNGRKATAKTAAMAEIVEGQSAISITPTRSLARDQAERFGGVFLQDADFGGGRILNDGEESSVVTGCVPSVHRLAELPCDVLILDELTATLEFLFTANFKRKDGRRQDKIDSFKKLVRKARLVIISDSDLTSSALRFIEKIRGENAVIITTDRKPLTYDAYFVEHIELIDRIGAHLKEQPNTLVPIHCDTKAEAEQLSFYFGAMGYPSLLITSLTSGDEFQREFLQSKGDYIPKLLDRGIRLVIASPTIQNGFNITSNADKVSAVFMSCTGSSITPEGVAQTLDRWRCPAERFIYAPKCGKAFNRLSRATNKKSFIIDANRISKASLGLTRNLLNSEISLDWDCSDLQYLADIGVNRNLGMAAFRARIKALLRHDGKRVHVCGSSLPYKQSEIIRDGLKIAKGIKDYQNCVALNNAEAITEDEAKELQDKEALSPSEQLSLQRYFIEQFYKTSISMDLIEFDRKGRTRTEIQRIEDLIVEDYALKRTANSIENNPSTPQDWGKNAVRAWLMNESGFGMYMKAIVNGRVRELKPEDFTPIVDWIRQHPQEYALAFGFSPEALKNIGDRQLLGTMLRWYGIKTIRKNKGRVEGQKNKFEYTYFVDVEHLGLLLAVLERRNPGVSPLSYRGYKEKGETPIPRESRQSSLPPKQSSIPSPDEIRTLIAQKMHSPSENLTAS